MTDDEVKRLAEAIDLERRRRDADARIAEREEKMAGYRLMFWFWFVPAATLVAIAKLVELVFGIKLPD